MSTFGSVTGAAAALHLTPSAVSQQLASCSAMWASGCRATGRGVRLTPAGALLARRGTRSCPRSRARKASSTGNASHVVGDLEIAGFATAARAILPQPLPGFGRNMSSCGFGSRAAAG